MLDLSDIVAIIRLSWFLGMGIMLGFTASVLWRRRKRSRKPQSIMIMLGMLRREETTETVTSLLKAAAKRGAWEREVVKNRLRKLLPIWIRSADYERLNWVNLVMQRMWPFLNKTLCATLNELLPPVFDQLVAEYGAPLIALDFRSLGSSPPELGGVKVVSSAAKELTLEMEVKCFTDPDVRATISKWGLSLHAEVNNVLFGAHLRFTLKPLIPMLPCFGTIHMSLMKPPSVDFGLKLFGLDLMVLPGVHQAARYILKELLFSLFGWPEKLVIPVFDENKFADMQSQLAKARMRVTLVEARALRKMDMLALSDPFVELSTRATRAERSTVKHCTLDPVWDETFDLVVEDRSAPLRVKVLDHDKFGKSRFMGIAYVDLKPLQPWEEADLWVDLSDDPNKGPSRALGSVHLRLLYTPFKERAVNDLFSDEEVEATPNAAAAYALPPRARANGGNAPAHTHEVSEGLESPSEWELPGGIDPFVGSETGSQGTGGQGESAQGIGMAHAQSSSESLVALDRANGAMGSGSSPWEVAMDGGTSMGDGGGSVAGGSVHSVRVSARRRLSVGEGGLNGAGALFVTLLCGKNLTPMDMNGKADPFVVMRVSGSRDVRRSKVCKKTLNPVWNETFEFMVNHPARKKLMLEVWDKDLLGKEFMGQVEIDLADVVHNGRVNDSWHLNDVKKGELLLELVWQAVA